MATFATGQQAPCFFPATNAVVRVTILVVGKRDYYLVARQLDQTFFPCCWRGRVHCRTSWLYGMSATARPHPNRRVPSSSPPSAGWRRCRRVTRPGHVKF